MSAKLPEIQALKAGMFHYAATDAEDLSSLRVCVKIYVSSLWADQINRRLLTIEYICLPENTFVRLYSETIGAWVTLKPILRCHGSGCFHGKANSIYFAKVARVHGVGDFR